MRFYARISLVYGKTSGFLMDAARPQGLVLDSNQLELLPYCRKYAGMFLWQDRCRLIVSPTYLG